MKTAVQTTMIFIVGFFLLYGGLDHLAAQITIGQVCYQNVSGDVLVSAGEIRQKMLNDGSHMEVATPHKVVLTEALSDATLVCRESADGTTCKTIAELFK